MMVLQSRLVVACIVSMMIALSHASQRHVLVGVTKATLLSGSTLTDCTGANVNISGSCIEGIASVAYVARQVAASSGITPIIYPYIDRQTAFVQMHPLTWAVNVPILQHFGYATGLTPPSMFSSDVRSGWAWFFNSSFSLSFANVRLDSSDVFYSTRTAVSISDSVAFISTDINASPNTLPVAAVMDALLHDIQLRQSVDFTIQHHQDTLITPAELLATYGARKPDVLLWSSSTTASGFYIDNTLVLPVVLSSSFLHILNLTYDSTQTPSVSGSLLQLSLTVPIGTGDAQYYADQIYLSSIASAASANDPVLGSSDLMPVHRANSLRLCFGGECPGGQLFTQSMRYVHSTQISLTSSGAFRGPGWPAGTFKISNVWAMAPFADQICYGTLMGLSIWQILNYSAAMSTAPSTALTSTGDRLLQAAGLRYTFDPNATYSRLVNIEVLSNVTGLYEPLDRLKLYTYAADAFLVQSYTPFPQFFAARFTGEVAPTCLTNKLTQTDVTDYMAAVGYFNTGYQGSIALASATSSTTTASFVSWTETQSSCGANLYWVADLASCIKCPAGKVSPAGSSVCSDEEKSHLGTILAIAIPVGAVVLGLILAKMIYSEFERRKNVRNVDNAPKSGQITLLFTDIQDSTKLWGACPASMSTSLDHHHALIRECIARHKGYEVKTVGDCFMIAVGDVNAGVSLALDIQYALQKQPFPRAIRRVYQCENEDELDAIDDNPDDVDEIDPLFNGLRVRIGMHTGQPDVVFDEVTRGYDYYGPPVNVAARVESTARGGQINASRDVVNLLAERSDIEVIFMGAVELKGVSGLTEILHIVPTTLKGRVAAYQEWAKRGEESKEVSTGGIDSDEQSTTMSNTMMGGDSEAIVKRFVVCFSAALHVMKPKDQMPILESFCKAWRVDIPKKDLSVEEMIRLFAGRATKGMKRTDAAFAGSFRNANLLGASGLVPNPSPSTDLQLPTIKTPQQENIFVSKRPSLEQQAATSTQPTISIPVSSDSETQ